MAVTMKQVAQRSGLSLVTVSYVLNQKGHLFRPDTRSRVLKAAEELGYRPNSSAKAMRQGRFNSIALLLSNVTHRSTATPEYLAGVDSVLSRHGLHLTVSLMPDERLIDPLAFPKILREAMADGLLIHYYQEYPQEMVKLIEQHKLPAVWSNVKREVDSVRPDDLLAGKQLTEHLLQLGHRRIAYVDYNHLFDPRRDHYSVFDRYEGYCQAMRQAGLVPWLLSDRANYAPTRMAEVVAGWLGEAKRPTAVVAYGLRETQAIVLAAAWRGLRVPRDLSVVAFGGQPLDIGVTITTAVTPDRAMGEQATQMLLEKIADPTRHHEPQVLPCRLAMGATSIAPFPTGRGVR